MKKITITLSVEQLEKMKKIYELSKKTQPNFDISFDDFIEKMVINSLETHLQFNEMNENMNKMLKNITDTMGLGDNFKVDDALKDFDNMVQEIFKNNVENKKPKNNNDTNNNDKKIKN